MLISSLYQILNNDSNVKQQSVVTNYRLPKERTSKQKDIVRDFNYLVLNVIHYVRILFIVDYSLTTFARKQGISYSFPIDFSLYNSMILSHFYAYFFVKYL